MQLLVQSLKIYDIAKTIKNLRLVFGLLLMAPCFKSIAQTAEIRGTVTDTSLHEPLYQASVVLIQAKDSFIVADTRADSVGRFSFDHLLDTAKYILLFSYPRYADYSYLVDMKEAPNYIFDMRDVNMIRQGQLLKEVIVRSATGAIRIRGDTTEYIADSFNVQPNATAEDLLKQLPGLQVDQYGNITAQGQRIKRVLVDGEEFFSDDPTLVTRNLRADMISTVQVYDKKSDAATFTGIDDGVKEKTINLKIKEDKNHGIFGKAEAGGGSDHHYIGQGMLNAFKGSRKMAVYGTTSNIGRVGLGSDDKQTIGDNSDDNTYYNGEGLPKSIAAGAHYNNKWNEGKESVNTNYKYNEINIQGSESEISQNNLPTGFIRSEAGKFFENRNVSHKANGKYIHKLDTTSTVTIYADGYFGKQFASSGGSTEVRRDDDSRINHKIYTSQNGYQVNSYNLNLSWEKKLKKYRRTISFYFNNNFNHDESDGSGRSESKFYGTDDIQDSTALLHLNKRMNDDWRTNTFNVNYTEPLADNLALLVDYKLENSNVIDDKRSYNLANIADKGLIDTLFSTRIDEIKWTNQVGVSLNYTPGKIVINVGNNVGLNAFNFNDHYQPLSLKRRFVDLNPKASFRYNPSQLKRFYFEYSGNSTDPTRGQLLAYNYNNSQLTTYLPNADLQKSFINTIYSSYLQVYGMGDVFMGADLKLSLTGNPIALSSVIAPDGSYTYRYDNLDSKDNNTYSGNIYYGRSVWGWRLRSSLGIDGGMMYSKINEVLNRLNYSTYSLNLYTGKEKPEKYSFSLFMRSGYTNVYRN